MSSTPPTFPPPEPPTGPASASTGAFPPPSDDQRPGDARDGRGPAHRARRIAVGTAVVAGAALTGVIAVSAARQSSDTPASSIDGRTAVDLDSSSGAITGGDDGIALDPGQFGTGDGADATAGGDFGGGLPPGPPPGDHHARIDGAADDGFGPTSEGALAPSQESGQSDTGALPSAPSGAPDASSHGS